MADLKHITSPSIDSAPAESCAPTYDDVELNIGHLRHLLEVTLEHLQDLPFTREDGSRIIELEEVHSLLWIARDMADKLRSDFGIAHNNIEAGETCNA